MVSLPVRGNLTRQNFCFVSTQGLLYQQVNLNQIDSLFESSCYSIQIRDPLVQVLGTFADTFLKLIFWGHNEVKMLQRYQNMLKLRVKVSVGD